MALNTTPDLTYLTFWHCNKALSSTRPTLKDPTITLLKNKKERKKYAGKTTPRITTLTLEGTQVGVPAPTLHGPQLPVIPVPRVTKLLTNLQGHSHTHTWRTFTHTKINLLKESHNISLYFKKVYNFGQDWICCQPEAHAACGPQVWHTWTQHDPGFLVPLLL